MRRWHGVRTGLAAVATLSGLALAGLMAAPDESSAAIYGGEGRSQAQAVVCTGSIWTTDEQGTSQVNYEPGQNVYIMGDNLATKGGTCSFEVVENASGQVANTGSITTDQNGDATPQLVFATTARRDGNYTVRVTCDGCLRSDQFSLWTPTPTPTATPTTAPTSTPTVTPTKAPPTATVPPTSTPGATSTPTPVTPPTATPTVTRTPRPTATATVTPLATRIPPDGCSPKTTRYWTSHGYDGDLTSTDALVVLTRTLRLNIDTGYLSPDATYEGKASSVWLDEAAALADTSGATYDDYVAALDDIVNGNGIVCTPRVR
jgi:hypothetical protein